MIHHFENERSESAEYISLRNGLKDDRKWSGAINEPSYGSKYGSRSSVSFELMVGSLERALNNFACGEGRKSGAPSSKALQCLFRRR